MTNPNQTALYTALSNAATSLARVFDIMADMADEAGQMPEPPVDDEDTEVYIPVDFVEDET